MDEQHALRSMQKYAEKMGLHLTLHMLRKWLGTMLYYERVPLKVIQQRLGHADMRTTARWYIHMQSVAEREGARVASQLLDRAQQGSLWSSDGSEAAEKASLAVTLAATRPSRNSSFPVVTTQQVAYNQHDVGATGFSAEYLLNRCTVKSCTQGSNPCLSASFQ